MSKLRDGRGNCGPLTTSMSLLEQLPKKHSGASAQHHRSPKSARKDSRIPCELWPPGACLTTGTTTYLPKAEPRVLAEQLPVCSSRGPRSDRCLVSEPSITQFMVAAPACRRPLPGHRWFLGNTVLSSASNKYCPNRLSVLSCKE